MTEKLYFDDAYLKEFDAKVLSCEPKGALFLIELDRSAFYPEGGGQPADHGTLNGIAVTDVHEKDGIVLHYAAAPLAPGTSVRGEIDWERRFDHIQQHSGEHIISGLICERFHCDNVGFHLGEKLVTIDYNAVITEQDAAALEERTNHYIWENHAFVSLWPSPEELEALDFRSKKALSGAVRIAEFPGADRCACCGTHVRSSAEVGLLKIVSVQKFREGSRLEILCGKRAFDYLNLCTAQDTLIAKALSTKPEQSYEVFRKQQEEFAALKLRTARMEEEYFDLKSEQYRGAGDTVLILEPMSPDSLRRFAAITAPKCGGRLLAFAGAGQDWKYVVIHEGQEIGPFVKDLNQKLSGRGGGRNGFAQGSLGCTEEALRAFAKAL